MEKMKVYVEDIEIEDVDIDFIEYCVGDIEVDIAEIEFVDINGNILNNLKMKKSGSRRSRKGK